MPGGAVRRSAAEVVYPIDFRMIVMKNAMAYAGIVEARNMNAGCGNLGKIAGTIDFTTHRSSREADPVGAGGLFWRLSDRPRSRLCLPQRESGSPIRFRY